jgi:hypothetical protein
LKSGTPADADDPVPIAILSLSPTFDPLLASKPGSKANSTPMNRVIMSFAT